MPNELKILYIASASRSGSTILEHTLGALGGVCNCGELRRLRDFFNDNQAAIRDPANRVGCTCGVKVRDCAFWHRVEVESGLDFSTLRIASRVGAVNRALFKLVYFLTGARGVRAAAKIFSPFRRELQAAEECFRLYAAIAKVSGSRVIVDSSKMVHQFLMLSAARPGAVKLIVLVRDGRAVSKSMIRGDRENDFGKTSRRAAFTAAVCSWAATSAQMVTFFMRTPVKDRLFLKYEAACADMEAVVRDIRARFDITAEDTGGEVAQTHAIGGSPSRFGAAFASVKVDERWRDEWSREDQQAFGVCGRLMNRILGYR